MTHPKRSRLQLNFGFESILFLAIIAALTVSSVFASLWKEWPGDALGIRVLQGFLNGATTPATKWVNFLGDEFPKLGLVVVVSGWLIYVRRPRMAALLAAVIIIGTFFVMDLKWLVHRPSPRPGDDFKVLGETAKFAFPSGHVAFAGIFFGTLIFFVHRHWRRSRWKRRALILALFAPVVLMGPSRIAWGIHWPSDVLGGYLVAILGILLVRVLHRKFIDRHTSGNGGGVFDG